MTTRVIDFVPVLDTAAYAADDVLFVPTKMPGYEATCTLQSVVVIDVDDQGIAMDLFFLNATASLGALNAAFAPDDTNAAFLLGRLNIATGDYLDLGANRLATKTGIGLVLRPGATGLWVAGVTRGGTPTYSVSGLKFKFGVLED